MDALERRIYRDAEERRARSCRLRDGPRHRGRAHDRLDIARHCVGRGGSRAGRRGPRCRAIARSRRPRPGRANCFLPWSVAIPRTSEPTRSPERWSSRSPRTRSTLSWLRRSGRAVAGAPGAWGYRALNTLDSMVGHRSPRYARYGWASARLDDAAGWVPARLTAALVALVRPRGAAAVWRAVVHQAPRHPSPNAGVAEAAFAGALGVCLGGVNRYGDRVERRPDLGEGGPPAVRDIEEAIRLSSDVSAALVVLLVAVGLVRWNGGRAAREVVALMTVPPPGAHGGDGRSVARALGIDPADILDLSQSLNPLAPDPVPVLARHVGRHGSIRMRRRRPTSWRRP